MNANIAILSALCLLFLMLSAFFSASETAIFSIPRERIESFKAHSAHSKRLIYELLMDGQRTLLLILLGNLFVNITLAGIVNSLMAAILGRSATFWGFLAATASIIVFGEVLPKNTALVKNEGIAAFASPILFYLMKLLSPLLNIALKVNHFFLSRFTPRIRENTPFITIGELKSAVRSSFEQGVISKSEQGVITNLLDKGAQPVKRIMTHRSKIPLLPHYATATEALSELSAHKQTFALITSGPRNPQVTGIVTLSDLFKATPNDRCRQLATAPQWAPETIAAADLISFMFAEKQNIVCVVDEFGGLSGALTLMDGLSKVMGATPKRPFKSAGNTRVFTGLQEIETITEWLPECLTAQAKDAQTINGLITRHLGRIPKTGERFDIGDENFYIMYAGPTRIESVLIVRKED
ncbi:MAG: CNNM domain-containing protein [Chitinispirillales bacterium]|jgi:CBS domain containing-hemolysin-like protein|nr:CNNM domain-containing protein [Chitinispirillales bacterium]